MGQKIITAKDAEAMKNNFDAFIDIIPTVVLYDSAGKLTGFSMEVPPPAVFGQMLAAVATGDATTLMNLFTSEAGKPVYVIPYQKPGTYSMVVYSPNYPIYSQQITLAAGDNIVNINFETALGGGENVPVTATISGTITDKDNPAAKLAGASITLKTRGFEKTVTADSDGKYSIEGLGLGLYYMGVSASGYALKADKVSISEYKTITKDIALPAGGESLTGTVYARKFPSPLVYEGAKIVVVLEDVTETMLAAYTATSDSDGKYTINGLINGKKYRLFVIVPGKKVEAISGLTAGLVSGVDFTLKDILPELNVKFIIDGSNVTFNIFSLKTLPTAPTVLHKKVDKASLQQSDGGATADTLTAVTTSSDTWTCVVPLPDSDLYTMKVSATDSAGQLIDKYIEFKLATTAKIEVLLNEILAEGGDVNIDETGTDPSAVTVPVGGIEETSSGATNLADNSSFSAYTATGEKYYGAMAIGGATSALMSFSKEAKTTTTGMVSDIYEVSLENASIEKDLLVTLYYDRASVTDNTLLNIRYYDTATSEWKIIGDQQITINPLDGTVSAEMDSTKFSSAGFGSLANAMATQSSQFAVFNIKTTANDDYAGTEFTMYNFPNPFDLNSKTVTITNPSATAQANPNITGTMLKYSLPSTMSGAVKLYIYNVAGELVRTIDEGTKTGGFYYYVEWDGKNKDGASCASGVYFLIPKVGDKKALDKPVKLAIIK